MKKAVYKHSKATWRGIELRIRYQPEYFTGAIVAAHLEVWSVKPEREPLPITETGYKSLFLGPEIIACAGGPTAYVLAWLEDKARSQKWKTADMARRQLSLFQ